MDLPCARCKSLDCLDCPAMDRGRPSLVVFWLLAVLAGVVALLGVVWLARFIAS